MLPVSPPALSFGKGLYLNRCISLCKRKKNVPEAHAGRVRNQNQPAAAKSEKLIGMDICRKNA